MQYLLLYPTTQSHQFSLNQYNQTMNLDEERSENGQLQLIRIQLNFIIGKMYQTVPESPEDVNERLVTQMQKEIFAFLQVNYQVNNISINREESIHTIFLPTVSKERQCENFYISHGFGGSALMSFPIIKPLLEKGNVIFWEIRGMGFSHKLNEYLVQGILEIQKFFLRGIQAVLMYYKHSNCTFIAHSFSSYLVLLFCIRFPSMANNHIKRLVLLSAIGITSKQEDSKNSIQGISDILHTLLNKFGWAFSLTYKSPLRTICRCCKQSLIKKSLSDLPMSEAQQELLCKIIQTLILLPDGSQALFFDFFEPRVLPKVALEPLLVQNPPQIAFVYGGEEDWVDKTGAIKLSERFPTSIKFKDIQNIGHNIPFYADICRNIFAEIF